MRYIYVLLTRSSTAYSRLIRAVTGDEYTHVSLGLGDGAEAVGTDHFAGDYLVILNLIHFKKLSFSKMLKYVSIVIGYCYLHVSSSSFLFIPIYSRVFSTVFLQAFSLF